MGRRGPAPEPTKLRVLKGNLGKRALPKGEAKPAPVAPGCPAFLDLVAKGEWKRLSKELESLGLLTRIDRAALAAYCQLYSRWAACEKVIAEGGMTYEVERVDKKSGASLGLFFSTRPEVTIARQCLQLMKAYAQEFGLTPSSRSRISVPGPAQPGLLDDMLD